MADAAVESTATAAEVSLIVFCGAIACLLPPFSERIEHIPVLILVLSLSIACSLVLHLIFVGMLARAHGRSAGRYAALALVTLPIGSIVGLILYEWRRRVPAGGHAGA